MFNEKGNSLMLGILISLLIVGGVFAYYFRDQKYQPQSKISTSTTSSQIVSQNITDPKQALEALQVVLKVTSPITDRNNIDWLDQNNRRIPLTGVDFSLATSTYSAVGKYGNYKANDLNSITEESFKPLQMSVENFFTLNGFQKDTSNTFRNNTGLPYLNMGFTKGDLKCLINLTPRTDPFGDFFCGIIDQTQIAWRKELTPAINTTNDPHIVVEVSKLQGNYATGGVGTNMGGGAAWWAVKINGQWKEVWRGQNSISCKPVNQYNIPKEIYGDSCSTNY
jgi:hypothetical protein